MFGGKPASKGYDPFGRALLDEGFWYAPVSTFRKTTLEHSWVQGFFGTDPGGLTATVGYTKVDDRPYLTFTYVVLGKDGKPAPGTRPLQGSGIYVGGALPSLDVTVRRGGVGRPFADGRFMVIDEPGAEPLTDEALANVVPIGMTHFFTGAGWLLTGTPVSEGLPSVDNAVASWTFLDAALTRVGTEQLETWGCDFGIESDFFDPVARLFPRFKDEAVHEV